jgi:rhamnulose-1-phosphate aldolase
MNILETPAVQGFVRFCADGWAQGWHERNGGNLSYRMTESDVADCSAGFAPRDWQDIGIAAEDLAGEHFLITGTGKYFRNVELDPAANIGVIELDPTGAKYRVVWGLENGARPTSELPSHLLNQSVKKAATGGASRVLYHAHPPGIIALTFVLPLDSEVFTRELWEMMTECPIVFPAGVGVVGWKVPGGSEIALATSELMKTYDAAVWAHHGLFASGATFDETFGLMHTIEKSAQILLHVLAVGGKRQTITPQNFRDLSRAFGVDLPERFLK